MGKGKALWCFTNFDLSFNYDEYMTGTSAVYIIVGREVCPTTKRLHDQGFVYFSGARTSIKNVAKELGKCRVKMCDGNLDQNCDYCSKDEKVREFGIRPKQGNRTDLQAIRNSIMEGSVTVDDILCEHPDVYHQYGRTLHKLEDLYLRKKYKTEPTVGLWLWGATGVGKSHEAFKDYNPATHYVYPNDLGWWDGYTNQETVIINEFRGGIPYGYLLELCDKYPVSVRRRGREPMPFTAKKLIITSSLPPEEVYNNIAINDSIDQLKRRFKIVELKNKNGQEVV